jgi:hypothetical protein
MLVVVARLVGMYLRTTRRRNRDGSVVRYVQLARNRRVGGVTQAQVLLNLGREDQLDRDGLRRLVASINRYLGEPEAGPPADGTALAGDGLTVTESRPVGTVHLLDGLWRALDVDVALRKVLGSRRFTTDVERVLLALVATRAVDPVPKLSAAEWASHDVAIDGLGSTDEDHGVCCSRRVPVRWGRLRACASSPSSRCSASASVGVCRVLVPLGGDCARSAVVPALRAVLPGCGGAAR